jgi:hypothetical protein
VFTDYRRGGRHLRGPLQPQIGPLVAELLPPDVEVDVVNDAWDDPDWSRDYDLVFVSALHSEFDRARQISHYWRRRGATTVIGGPFASTYPQLCRPFFDAVVVGDPESTVSRIHADFAAGRLAPLSRRPLRPGSGATPRLISPPAAARPARLRATRGCRSLRVLHLTGLAPLHTRATARGARHPAGQRMLRGKSAWWQRRIVGSWTTTSAAAGLLRELRDALAPQRALGELHHLQRAARRRDVDRLSASGCRLVASAWKLHPRPRRHAEAPERLGTCAALWTRAGRVASC